MAKFKVGDICQHSDRGPVCQCEIIYVDNFYYRYMFTRHDERPYLVGEVTSYDIEPFDGVWFKCDWHNYNKYWNELNV